MPSPPTWPGEIDEVAAAVAGFDADAEGLAAAAGIGLAAFRARR